MEERSTKTPTKKLVFINTDKVIQGLKAEVHSKNELLRQKEYELALLTQPSKEPLQSYALKLFSQGNIENGIKFSKAALSKHSDLFNCVEIRIGQCQDPSQLNQVSQVITQAIILSGDQITEENKSLWANYYVAQATIKLSNSRTITALRLIEEALSCDASILQDKSRDFLPNHVFARLMSLKHTLYHSLFNAAILLEADYLKTSTFIMVLISHRFSSTYFVSELKNGKGIPLIILLSRAQYHRTLKWVISKNCDSDFENGWEAALKISAELGNIEMVKNLLIRECKIDSTLALTTYNALMSAVDEGHLEITKELINHHANVNCVSHDDLTPLMLASKKGKLEIAKELILAGAAIDFVNTSGMSALMFALENGHEMIAKELLKHKANVNCATKDGITALKFASAKGYLEIVVELIENGATIDLEADEDSSALMLATKNNHIEIVTKLIKHKANVNYASKNKSTALKFAATKGHLNILRLLIENGAIVDGDTLLKAASQHNATGHPANEIVKELIKFDADINFIGDYNMTPLKGAARRGNLEIVRTLITAGADIELAPNESYTPLMECFNQLELCKSHIVHNNQASIEVIKELLKHQANVNPVSREGETPLKIASSLGNIIIVQELIAHGAEVDFSSDDGKTALFLAAEYDNPEVITELVKHEANVNIVSKSGYTPLMAAAAHGSLGSIKALLSSGAKTDRVTEIGHNAVICCATIYWNCSSRDSDSLNIIKELTLHGADISSATKVGWTTLMLASKFKDVQIVKELLMMNATLTPDQKNLLNAEQISRIDRAQEELTNETRDKVSAVILQSHSLLAEAKTSSQSSEPMEPQMINIPESLHK